MTVQAALNINQGETFTLPVQWVSATQNLSGATVKLQIRAAPGGTPLVTLTSPSNGIALSQLGAVLDTMTITIPASTFVGSPFVAGFYDILITLADGSTKRLMQGPVAVSQQITV